MFPNAVCGESWYTVGVKRKEAAGGNTNGDGVKEEEIRVKGKVVFEMQRV